MSTNLIRRTVPLILLAALLVPLPGSSGGQLSVNGAGAPLVWDLSGGPVPFNPDLGTLGTLDNAGAVDLITSAFALWEAVPSSNLAFANTGSLPVDVTAANISTYLGVCDGLRPIIFDANGDIIRALAGAGAENAILGLAGIECGSFVPPVITESVALLNGRFIDGINNASNAEITLQEFSAVFIHEFGHYFNLDHTQINLDEAFDGISANDSVIPTMFPFLVNGIEQATLHKDDIVSVSTLYPAPDFFATTGTITGTILLADGISHFQGANVIARNVANPLEDAVSNVSGARYFPGNTGGPTPPSLEGLYEIHGLTPGASYTIEIEQINPSFAGGSSVGPVSPPRSLPGSAEFYNGADEAGTNPPDDPAAAGTPITVTAGVPATGIDVIINGIVDPNEPNDDFGSATSITCPANVEFNLGTGGGDVDFFTFTASAGTPFTAEIFASRLGSFDPILGLFDAAGSELAVNDDTFGLDSFLSMDLPASAGDVYFVGVTAFADFGFVGSHSQSGPYRLVLTCTTPLPPIPPDTRPSDVVFVGVGDRVLGFADTTGDGAADSQVTFATGPSVPAELAFDAGGRLFQSALTNGDVNVYTDSDLDFVSDVTELIVSGRSDGDGLAVTSEVNPVVFVSDVFGNADVTAVDDSNGDGLPDRTTVFATGMISGAALDLDRAGNLYVVDVFAGTILVCSDTDNDLVADTDPCPVFSAAVPGAVAIRIDAADNVFVLDSATESVRVLRDTDGDGVADAITTFATLPAEFFIPFGPTASLDLDAVGKVYVLASTNTILSYADADGDLIADGPPVTFAVVPSIAAGITSGALPPPVADAGVDQTVAGTSNAGTPVTLDGSASFDAGGNPLTYSWSGPFPEGGGAATGTSPTVTLGPGVNTISLTVSNGLQDSEADTVEVIVTDFALSGTPTRARAPRHGGTSFEITVSSQHGAFDRAVSLSCSGLPELSDCLFQPANVNPGAGQANSTLFLTTGNAGLAPNPTGPPALPPLWWLVAAGAMALVAVQARRYSRMSRQGWLTAVFLAIILLLQLGCGGTGQAKTPKGTYTVTITGQSGALTRTTNVTLVVK